MMMGNSDIVAGNDINSWSYPIFRWFIEKAGGANAKILIVRIPDGQARSGLATRDEESQKEDFSKEIRLIGEKEFQTQNNPDFVTDLYLRNPYENKTGSDLDVAEFARLATTATGIYFRGGDQSRYLQAFWFQNSPLLSKLQERWRDGTLGVLSGGSAGAHILSTQMISANNSDRRGPTALESLQDAQGYGLFSIQENQFPLFDNPFFIADTHFIERGRLPRLAGAMANGMLANRLTTRASEVVQTTDEMRAWRGVGLGSKTALLIENSGNKNPVATVRGADTVTLLRPTEQTKIRVAENTTPVVTDLDFLLLTDGYQVHLDTFEIVRRPPENERWKGNLVQSELSRVTNERTVDGGSFSDENYGALCAKAPPSLSEDNRARALQNGEMQFVPCQNGSLNNFILGMNFEYKSLPKSKPWIENIFGSVFFGLSHQENAGAAVQLGILSATGSRISFLPGAGDEPFIVRPSYGTSGDGQSSVVPSSIVLIDARNLGESARTPYGNRQIASLVGRTVNDTTLPLKVHVLAPPYQWSPTQGVTVAIDSP